MQVQPLIIRELAGSDLGIPHAVVRNAGVLQRHRHRIIPRRRVGRRVHGNLGCLFEGHGIHVAGGHRAAHVHHLGVAHRLQQHAVERRLAARAGVVVQQKAPPSVVEQPLGAAAALQRTVGDTVRL